MLDCYIIKKDGGRVDCRGDDVVIRSSSRGFSNMHFFGDEPGDGFFIRGDISYSTMTMDLDDREVYEESGYGLLVGGGYGWAITDETRILLSLLVKQVDVGDSDSQSVSFLIGGLW